MWWDLLHQVLSVKIRCRDKLTLTLNVTQDTARSFFLLFFKRHTDWLKLLDRTFYTCIFVQNYIFKYTPPLSQCNLHSISENLEFLHRAFSQKSEIIHTCAAHVNKHQQWQGEISPGQGIGAPIRNHTSNRFFHRLQC